MRYAKTIGLMLLMLWACRSLAQTQAPFRVGPFGGITAPLKPMKVPPELQPFVPEGKILRAVFHTQLTPSGETIFLYDDDGEKDFHEVHLGVLQNGRSVPIFDDRLSGVAGFYSLQLDHQQNGLVFAYHLGGDETDTEFAVFIASGGSFKRIFFEETMEGQMQFVSTHPARFELWSAAKELDPKDLERSCMWCPHRFRTEVYAWNGADFKLIHKHLTKKFLPPGPIAGNVFVVRGTTKSQR